jgi:hypothetical protein
MPDVSPVVPMILLVCGGVLGFFIGSLTADNYYCEYWRKYWMNKETEQ